MKRIINKKQKKVLLIQVALLCVIILLIIATTILHKDNINDQKSTDSAKNYVQNENGSVVNTSENISENKTVDGIILSQSKLVYEDGMSKLESKVTNNGVAKEDLKFTVKFIADDGSVIAQSVGFVGEIKPNETKYIASAITANVVNAKDVIYEIMN